MSTSKDIGSIGVERGGGLIPSWLAERHQERYCKVATREMSLEDALKENDADWQRASDELRELLP